MKKYIYIIFIVSIFVSFGCSSEPETTNTAVNTAPANAPVNTEPAIDVSGPFTPSENPKDDLLNSTQRLQAYDAWAATLQNDAMPELKTELEYVKPDRYRVKNADSEILVIGSDAYARQDGGEWEMLPEDIGAQINQMKKNFNAEGMKAIKEVTKSAVEKLNGKDATVYTYSIEPNEQTVENSTASGLPMTAVCRSKSLSKPKMPDRNRK